MSEALKLLQETAERLLAGAVTPALIRTVEAGGFPQALWHTAGRLGFLRAPLAEEKGGAGAGLAGAYPILFAAGYHLAPVPLAEAMLAAFLLDGEGRVLPEGVVTLAEGEGLAPAREGQTVTLSGTLPAVPFARHAQWLVAGLPARGKLVLALINLDRAAIAPGASLCGEPRDQVTLHKAEAHVFARTALAADALRLYGALMRSAQMAGALSRALDLARAHAETRRQFGRALASFQAVQHMLAVLAEEAAAAEMAAARAFARAENEGARPAVAAAKIRTGLAAARGAALAHEILGAMGLAREHPLSALTPRLLAWRSDFGGTEEWARLLGRLAAQEGANALWPFVARRL